MKQNCSTAKSGFNLVESAIVLGVIGLVIGGIWVAASAVQRENRRQDIRATIIDMNQRVAKTWANIAFSNPSSQFISLTQSIYDAEQIVPTSSLPANIRNYFGSANPYVFKMASGLYSSISAEINVPNLTTYAIGTLDKADCTWFGMSASSLLPVVNRRYVGHIFLTNSSGSFNIGYFDMASSQTNGLAITANCTDDKTNVYGLRASERP